MKQLLIIGHTFPEPSTTAAGSRMMQLVALFQEENYQITFASTAAISEKTANLEAQNISVKSILLNDASFDEFIKELNPQIVVFDRYITEEQFGWRVSETLPRSLKNSRYRRSYIFCERLGRKPLKKISPFPKQIFLLTPRNANWQVFYAVIFRLSFLNMKWNCFKILLKFLLK